MGEWVEPIEPISGRAAVVACPRGQLAWKELVEAIAAVSGTEVHQVESGSAEISFLLVGCDTEERVQAVAIFLRTVLGFDRVAICPHLVGSATSEAHFASLRHGLPQAGVDVVLDLWEAARWIGLDPEAEGLPSRPPCDIHPPDARSLLSDEARRIIELVCMHWTKTDLRALAGGFSGSLLFLADGWKGEARTEPMVLKIDAFGQMRRELDGYHQVKDFFGKHVPTFGYPVIEGDHLGVGMELAAMEGRPTTLQDHFEEAEDEASVRHFLARLDKALTLLTGKLYGNTLERAPVAPFRALGLHSTMQLDWLRANGLVILGYMAELGGPEESVDLESLVSVVRLVARNEDSLHSEVCLQHGDLNYANVICDDGDNTWFIDWTHSGEYPVELDFAKLESDAKFVMSKAFDLEDLPRLRKLEEYLLSQRIPAPVDELPDDLKFVKWDLRFRKILAAVRIIRLRLSELKEGDDWVVYRAALLRYALHTLSFDKRRGRGECTEVQLMHALYSCDTISLELVADDFHLKIRAERPSSYPVRQRISIDEALWIMDCDSYDPPYHVDESVLRNDRTVTEGGWADPENIDSIREALAAREARFRDEEGRPLNPRGRTGIAGRGLLGMWGANLSVAAVMIRTSTVTGDLEVLLGEIEETSRLELPKGFLVPDEDIDEGLLRVIESETGWRPTLAARFLSEGYTFDPRQTDHAWVERRTYLLSSDEAELPDLFEESGTFESLGWWPLSEKTMMRIPSEQAGLVQSALEYARDAGELGADIVDGLLARTG
jgi:ADP-ribose pyrophosphatase